jgi:hypothetical protein
VSGTAVIRYLLANAAAVVAVVPAARIVAGDLPLNTAMPAIAVTQIDSIPRLTVAMTETKRMHTDRVQVTVFRGASPADDGYPGLKSLLDLVLAACPNQRGSVNNIAVDSILPDTEGPDLPILEEAILTRSRDFIVRWTAAT